MLAKAGENEEAASVRAGGVRLPQPLCSSVPCSCFLINTADRIIRVYDGREILTCGRDGEPEPMQKLQDLVNRSDNTERMDPDPFRPPPPPSTPAGMATFLGAQRGLRDLLFPQDPLEALLLLR